MFGITASAYLRYGLEDRDVGFRDVPILADRLGNTKSIFRAERETFNHYDFVWEKDI